MAASRSTKASLSHEERTASEPRNSGLHPVVLECITSVNSRIKTYRFSPKDKAGINFLAGQWLDVHVPGIEKAGGFTITSPPRYAVPSPKQPEHQPYFELAVQQSPENPPAAWLWQPEEGIVGRELAVRVGGSFVWPPPGVIAETIERVVFIAGGVGINPLIAMASHLRDSTPSLTLRFLYSTKLPSENPSKAEVLFLPQLLELFHNQKDSSNDSGLELFFTGSWDGSLISQDNKFVRSLENSSGPLILTDRISDTSRMSSALGPDNQRATSVWYVCGPPQMTDSIVEFLRQQPGVVSERVLCEKWW